MTASLIPNLDGDSIMQCSNSKLLLSVHERIWEYTERQIGSEQQHIDPSPCWLPITHSSHMAQCIDQASVWCVCVHEEMHVLVFVCLCGKVVRSWSDHINNISGNNCKTLTLVNTFRRKWGCNLLIIFSIEQLIILSIKCQKILKK